MSADAGSWLVVDHALSLETKVLGGTLNLFQVFVYGEPSGLIQRPFRVPIENTYAGPSTEPPMSHRTQGGL